MKVHWPSLKAQQIGVLIALVSGHVASVLSLSHERSRVRGQMPAGVVRLTSAGPSEVANLGSPQNVLTLSFQRREVLY